VTDDYQRRYEEHRKRKAEAIKQRPRRLTERNPQRRSIRVFEDRDLPKESLDGIVESARYAPQSCNRQAMTLKVVRGTQVHNLLAGGEGWLGNARLVILVFADLAAYKSPIEVDFMPWLDAGVMLTTIAYAAHTAGLGACIVNPSIRLENVEGFAEKFNPEGRLFCGAVALGYAAVIPECPEKKPMEELVEWL